MKISNARTCGRGFSSAGADEYLDVAAYLERLGCAGPRRPSLQVLQALHLAHLRSVPFENLDVLRKVPILLDESALFRKIVRQGRGGFCYELNGLFACLLEKLGFAVERLSARVLDQDGKAGPEFDHLALRVEIGGGGWLADVGFGAGFELPVRLRADLIQSQPRGEYRLHREGEAWLVEERQPRAQWRGLYWVGQQPRRLEEFAAMCHYHQTSEESPFTRGRLCTRATPRGRLTLSGSRLIETAGGMRQKRELAGEGEFRQALREHFGIAL